MKTKILLIVLVLIALLFSGCDDILEAYYGIDTEEGWSKGEFRIELALMDIQSTTSIGPDAPLRIAMLPYYRMGDNWFEPAPWDTQMIEVVTDNEAMGGHGETDFVYTVFVPPGKYSFAVWHDINNDGNPGWEEPSRLFEYMAGTDNYGGEQWNNFFDLYEDQETGTINAYVWMWENDKMPEDLMELFNTGDDFQGDVFEFWTEGPMMVDSNSAPSDARYYIFANSGVTPETVDWEVYLDGSQVSSSGGDVAPFFDGSNYYVSIDWDSFINTGGSTRIEYDFYLNVGLNNGDHTEWRSNYFRIPVFPELAGGTPISIAVNMSNLNLEPVNLDYFGTYDLGWAVLNGLPEYGGAVIRNGTLSSIEYGEFSQSIAGDNPGSEIYYNDSSTGGTYLELIIDVDGDGYPGNTGDYSAFIPVLGIDGETTAWVDVDPWAFHPLE